MKIQSILFGLLVVLTTNISAQEKRQQWDLTGCIHYALDNNIQIRKSKIILEQSTISTKQAKAQLFPNLSASFNQNFTNHPALINGGSANSYTGNYGISSSMTLYNGGKTIKNIRQQKLVEEARKFDILDAEKDIQLLILQNYLQILYANESVTINKSTIAVSEYQHSRGENLLTAGSISKVDLAQLESQLSSDKYQLVVAENSLNSTKLKLKQLLELAVSDELNIIIPELNEVDILKPLPSLQTVYEASLNVIPQLRSRQLDIQIADLETQKAQSAYLPKVNLNASIGTNHTSGTGSSLDQQFKNSLNDGIGVSVNIPIFTNRETKSTVEKARLSEKTTQLNLLDAEKDLLQEIESVYQDALSAQSQYSAASEKVKALQTSYDLIEKQYKLGLKNMLELLTEKNNLQNAQQGMVQAKYLSIMNIQTLNLYQELPLEIK